MRKGLIVVVAVALFASIVSSVSVVQSKFSQAQVETEAEAMVELEMEWSLSTFVPKSVTCGLCKPAVAAVLGAVKSKGCPVASRSVASVCSFCKGPFDKVCPQIAEAAAGAVSDEQACKMMKVC